MTAEFQSASLAIELELILQNAQGNTKHWSAMNTRYVADETAEIMSLDRDCGSRAGMRTFAAGASMYVDPEVDSTVEDT